MVFVTHASAEESIEYDHTYQTPSYIIEKSPQKPVQNTTQKESLFSYLDKHQTQFKLKGNANSHFRVSKTIKDPKTKQTFFKLTEVYKGIPIYGFEQAVAMKENKQVKSFFGKVHPQIKDVSVTPSISEKKAIHTARRELEASIGKIEYLDGEPKGELYIYPHDGEYDLAYLVRLSTSEPEPARVSGIISSMPKTERSSSPLMPFMKRQVQESACQVMKKALTSQNKMGAFIWLTKQGEKGSIHLTRRT